jgi:hypothetical protein
MPFAQTTPAKLKAQSSEIARLATSPVAHQELATIARELHAAFVHFLVDFARLSSFMHLRCPY